MRPLSGIRCRRFGRTILGKRDGMETVGKFCGEERCWRAERRHCGKIPSGIVYGSASRRTYMDPDERPTPSWTRESGLAATSTANGIDIEEGERICVRRAYTRRIYTTHYRQRRRPVRATLPVWDEERGNGDVTLVMLRTLLPTNCSVFPPIIGRSIFFA